MDTFADYLARIDHLQHQARLKEILDWVTQQFPQLKHKIAWNQPMYTDHGTFIVGFSTAKRHLAVAPERIAIDRFSDEIVQAGYTHSKELVRIPWDHPVDFSLLQKIIAFNISDKADCATFWRKSL
ncbi:hypothetical protein NBRC111894_18 [Sporolactobacillus inulinus]|uniref:YdhG-like domain-containing protein n=1 Tax=Sporolactobacillus inulinus TaxID=2078 RepID=A0A4Y1Z630_9BACL|nr:iron chaperone [Sporolactobacillus inulinus]GAY74464.1 hypothetical protein NBRC111894_18 [Sporolactobacillus inulinus]